MMSCLSQSDFTIAYTVFNKGFLIERIVESLANFDKCQIIFLFDNCTDDSVEQYLVNRHKIPNSLGFVNSGDDLFETFANNWLLKQFRTKFCLLCQDDMVLKDPSILEQAIQIYQNRDNVGVIGFKDGYDMNVVDQYSKMKSSPCSSSKSSKELLRPKQYEARRFVNRGPLCISSATIGKVGYFSRRFYPLFWDDNDYCMKCEEQGLINFVSYADVKSKPEWGTTRGSSKIPLRDIYIVNKHLFSWKWKVEIADISYWKLLKGIVAKLLMVFRMGAGTLIRRSPYIEKI